MSLFNALQLLNDRHAMCGFRDTQDVLLNAIGELIDHGISLEQIETLVEISDFITE